MELYAIILAIKLVNKYIIFNINIFTDSKYIINIINYNFKIKKNYDLWEKFYKLYNLNKINFFWIKGHNKNYYNEKCNILAQKAIINNNLKYNIDNNYE